MKFNNNFFDQLSRSPEVEAVVVDAAERIAAAAIASAPVGETQEYRDGIHVEVKHQRRSVALVVSSDPKSMIIEAKTGKLVRAVKAARRG